MVDEQVTPPTRGGWTREWTPACDRLWPARSSGSGQRRCRRATSSLWPLNPLGFSIAANWNTGHIFCSALLAWFLKLVILRYGGVRLYCSLRPFFLGLILGEIVAAGLFLVIDYITGHTGSS